MADIPTQPLDIEDFSGGMTDYYVGAGLSQFQTGDNLLVTPDKKLETRWGSQVIDLVNNRPSTNRIGTIITTFDGDIYYQSAGDLYSAGALTRITGPANTITPNGAFLAGDASSTVGWGVWNKHVVVLNDAFSKPMKVFKDESGAVQLRTAGLPRMGNIPTVAAQNDPGAGTTYSYKFIYYYEYRVKANSDPGDTTYVTFADFGPSVTLPTLATKVNVISAAHPMIVSLNAALPTSGDNYELTGAKRVRVRVYRTTNAGSQYYEVTDPVNPANFLYHDSTSFSDSMDDVTLQTKEPVYTSGGVLDNEPPPLAKCVHVVDQVALYGNIKDPVSGEVLSNRVRQSVPGDFDSCPYSLYDDLEDSVVTISSVNGKPVVLCNHLVYRMDGIFDESGRGGMSHQRISDVAGCVSAQSVVQTQAGIFWAGQDGFYFSDAFQVQKISLNLNETYKTLVSDPARAKRIQGKYDPQYQRIWWTVQKDSTIDCDICFVLDLNQGIKPESCFTTVSGGASFSPTALAFTNQKQMIRGDRRGYLFLHDPSFLTDPKVDTSVAPSLWSQQTVIWSYLGPCTNFGTDMLRKWTTRLNLVAKSKTNCSIQVTSINDDGKSTKPLKPIRYRGATVWGDPATVWGDSAMTWGLAGLIKGQLRFPANSLRCSFKQIAISNAFCIIQNSNGLGAAIVNQANKTALLPSTTWPTDSVDYFISFATDGYHAKFPITAVSGNTLSFADPSNIVASAQTGWVIEGYPKGEVLSLLGYTIHFAVLGQTMAMFHAGDDGANS